jgi:hypothetical protein
MTQRIEQSLALADWIVDAFAQLKPSRDIRAGLSSTCFYIVWQHQAAIPRLCREGLFAPATALLRCALDSYIRGMWIHRGASDDALELFIKSLRPPHIEEMMKQIDKADSTPQANQSIYVSNYSSLCDATHSGIGQLARNFDGKTIMPQLSNEDESKLLIWVEALALSSLGQAAQTANNTEIATQALNKLRQISQTES